MAIDSEHQAHVEGVAKESLSVFAQIATTAQEKLDEALSRDPAPPVNNTFTNPNAAPRQRDILQTNIESYQQLRRSPAVARVVVADEDDKLTTYFVCSGTAITIPGPIKLASYLSDIGRIAARPIRDEVTVRQGGKSISVEIRETGSFQPALEKNEWDGRNAHLKSTSYRLLTVVSLRELLKKEVGEDLDTDLLDRQLADAASIDNLYEGIKRTALSKIALRNQPVLDRYQDDIFRLPLDSRLLLLGAPGTGKTTTLIRRLRQKLDVQHLTDDERHAVQTGSVAGDIEHVRNWIMFTPTELLRLYVKEAFNQEGVAAPDNCIVTWNDFRDDVARNQFGVLRTANGGHFIMKSAADTLQPNIQSDLIIWYTDFDNWQKRAFWDEVRASAKALSEHASADIAGIGKRLAALVDRAGSTPAVSLFDTLQPSEAEILRRVATLKEVTDKKIRGALNTQLKANTSFLDELAAFLDSLREITEEPDDQDVDDDDETPPPRTGRLAAQAAYIDAIRAKARARTRKRAVSKTGRTGKILEWIGDRTLNDDDLLSLGNDLVTQSDLRWFVGPVRRYVERIPNRYRAFRKLRQQEGKWYRAEATLTAEAHPLEVDVVLLAMFRNADELLTKSRVGLEKAEGGLLQRFRSLYRTQVLVDEVTDFSPLQLACMSALARPGTRSFFACGDFNQRITSWGTRSFQDIQWAAPGIQKQTVRVAYRQSKQLHELAQRLVTLSGETADSELPGFVENIVVAPVLGINVSSQAATSAWLKQRIVEIERLTGLPTVAVLVNSEEEVVPLASALDEALADHNIRAIPCPNGQVKGNENGVRVFDVQHIKGLEFEAVFFVGIDRLAEKLPDLFNKYLYVGATRAATYLGVSCEAALPAQLVPIRDCFAETWKNV